MKFKSATPFMALGYEFHSDGRIQALTPFGQRTPTINPAGGVRHQENMSVKCIPPHTHFCKVKLGFTGVYLLFLFLIQNIDCGYSLEPPRTVRRF